MKPSKCCPVCGSKTWNYDVIPDEGTAFCGDCYFEVKRIAKEHLLMKWTQHGFMFPTEVAFTSAVKLARASHLASNTAK